MPEVITRRMRSGGVDGNARLTGAAGAMIFVLLAIEGVTILRVQQLLSAHVFVGMLLVPLVTLKIGTTLYRFGRYYGGDADYTVKGPPPFILRLAGPVVVASTVAVFATGIAAITVGPSARWIVELHKLSFIAWFGVTTVHVLGHILETPALAVADWRRQRRPLAGTGIRRAILVAAFGLGLALAFLALGWVSHWHHLQVRG